MREVASHDIVILGSGLAGLRAALEAAMVSRGKVDIALVSKVQLMRSHSACAEGGTAAVLRPEEGDSLELHAWDTVKGSDFLADQDVVDRFVRMIPEEILRLDHWGLPWSRRPNGQIDQRPFGGHSYPRATFAADKTGFFEMHALYDALQQYNCVTRYDEWFCTSLLTEGDEFRGLAGIDLSTGEHQAIAGKALIVCTGGAGRLFGYTTYSQTVTGDGLALAYRAGIALKDMEFLQFHPTGIVPSGILMTEGCRGEGGYLRDNTGTRFMQNYAPERMELAPRDITSRSMITEILAGRGFPGPRGLDYLHLDLTHLGADKINERLPLIREVCIHFLGIDPIDEPIPVRPVAHYSMGGINNNIEGATRVKNLWAAGEAGCQSLHGANRLGCNSTAECLVWGKITGAHAAEYSANHGDAIKLSEAQLQDEDRRIEALRKREGDENLYSIRADLWRTMDQGVGVYRTAEDLQQALDRIKQLQERALRAPVKDQSRTYNTDLTAAFELGFVLEIAEAMVAGALARQESRGGHARRDFPARDDENWLKHTLAFRTPDGPRLDYSEVTITTWKPVERKY
jgi:succinate dehydrogenase / fumarate reductase flavoprotein subunit